MRSILFWVLIFAIKIYVYIGMTRTFKKPIYRRIAIAIALISFTALGVGFYAAFNELNKGIVHPPLWANFSIGLIVTFFVCEMLLFPFFLMDDIIALFKRGYRYFKLGESYSMQPSRRKFVKKTGLIVSALPFMSFLHGITRGKYNFTVHHQPIAFDDLPDAFDGFRILQISDIHSGSFDNYESVRAGIQMIQDQKADMIVFTGDLVNNHAEEIEPFIEDFKKLSAPYGKFSILGNHDYPLRGRMFDDTEHRERNFEQIKQHHASMGFNLMLNDNAKIEKEGQYFRLLGVENWGRSHHFPKEGDLDKACVNCDEKEFTVLLSHDPTHWADKVIEYTRQIHLTLSGHTHGMQMGIDLPSFKWSPVKYAYKHWAGLYKENDKHLYVNRGFGFLGFAGRVGVYPEITILELKKA